MYYENALTGQRMKTTYDVDRNLDGQFDEKDAQVKYNLNFALLVSPFSWSCGNMLPALLKDYGIPLIGMHTGGGSCAILYNPSCRGFGKTPDGRYTCTVCNGTGKYQEKTE